MFRSIKLRVGIAFAYALVMVPLTLGMIGYLYYCNAKVMRDTARLDMQRVAASVRSDLQALLRPVALFVETTAELVESDPERVTDIRGLGYFHKQLSAMPQLFSVYTGFEKKGDFYQIFHIPQSMKSFGPWREELDGHVQYAVRYIDDSPGERADSYIFYRNWGDVVRVGRENATYDPRKRPWYEAAWQRGGVNVSDAYVFASSKIVGMTISYPVTTTSGALIGAVGADITLDSLSSFLKKSTIGNHGRVFLLDKTGHLVGHENPLMGIHVLEDSVELLPATEVKDQIVADAVQMWRDGGADHFTAQIGSEQRSYLASFSSVDVGGGNRWIVGVLVDENDFIGPLRETSFKIVLAGIIAMSLAIVAITTLSKALTTPIRKIVDKTDRIRCFDLEGELEVSSRISEVHQLTAAVATMTRSLRSFSVYVPRELVRAIVSEQGSATLVSRRQPLTVMMTDIQGYTSISENAPPEEVVEYLNQYFDRMTSEIHKHSGIVDKYIGDAVMSMWNAPKADEDHVLHACRAALACRDVARSLAFVAENEGRRPYITRIGLHTGEAVVGNVGSSDRMQYSAIGAMINLTSRLEALNKLYGTNLLVSQDIAHAVWDKFLFRCLDKVVPVGTSQPILVYELIAEITQLDAKAASLDVYEERLTLWQSAMDAYFAKEWSTAIDTFTAYQMANSDSADTVAQVFIERCQAYEKEPPAEDWDGALWLTHKS